MGIRRHVLRDEVEDLILERLMENHWAPGARLSIDGLARDLDVSPTPVREAMVSLEGSGLVDYVALRGYVVAPMLDEKQMVELLEARRTVESAALDQAFEQWDAFQADLSAAHELHGEVIARIEAAKDMDYALFNEHYQADWAFHHVFFEHADNRYLRRMVENLRTHTHRMRQAWTGGPSAFDGRQAHEEHGRILDMVARNNHDGALRELSAHLDAILECSRPAADGETAAD